MGWGSVLSQLSGGPLFRKHRKITQEAMGGRSVNEYSTLQKKTTYMFLADIGDAPAKFADHVKRWVFLEHVVDLLSHSISSVDFVRSFHRKICLPLTFIRSCFHHLRYHIWIHPPRCQRWVHPPCSQGNTRVVSLRRARVLDL